VLLDEGRQPLRDRHPAAADADEDEIGGATVALHDLVCDAGQGPAQLIGAEDAAFAHWCVSPWRPRRTALKASRHRIPDGQSPMSAAHSAAL
jgi:hypothetical protein